MFQKFSEELDRNKILQKLNADEVKVYYPAVVYLGTLSLLGIIGNLTVLSIYIFKKPNNNTRTFVCFVAIIDLVACAICFPFYIVRYLHPLMYYNNPSCKILSFLNHCVVLGSALSLLVIAIERYRKICKPFLTQISLKCAKRMCAVVILLTAVASSPVLHFFGSTEISTNHPNITGYECHVRVELRKTVFLEIYSGFFAIGYLGCCTILTVLYILIGIQVWQQQAKRRKAKTSNIPRGQGEDRVPVKETDKVEMKSVQISNVSVEAMPPDIQNDDNDQPESSEQENSFTSPANKSKPDQIKFDKFNKMKKTTYMFIGITFFYVLGLVPFPILRLYQIFNTGWHTDISHYGLVTVFLNNVVNVVVYTICDQGFREELISCYKKIFCRK